MKKILFLIILVINSFARADYAVVVRNEEHKLVQKLFSAEDIGFHEQDGTFEHFVIYEGQSETAVKLETLTSEKKLKVMTLAYHLNKAFQYYSKYNSEYLNSLGKIPIRFDIDKGFSFQSHFSPSNEFNNARTIRQSGSFIDDKANPWPIEIWFDKPKPVQTKIPPGMVKNIMKGDKTIIDQSFPIVDSAVIQAVQTDAMGMPLSMMNTNQFLSQFELVFLLQEALPDVMDVLVSVTSSNYFLDAAFVPEIIYHEMCHVAMSDKLPLTSSFAIAEGICNYFAAVISNHDEIAGNVDPYGKNIKSIKFNKEDLYKLSLEKSDSGSTHAPFSYNFLTQLRSELNADPITGIAVNDLSKPVIFDSIVFDSRKYIDLTNSRSISQSLPTSLITAIREVVPDKNLQLEYSLKVKKAAVDFGM
jgi:hypothetical protein